MPVEITVSDGHVSEVRFVCDSCGLHIGTQLMFRSQAEAHRNTKVICQNCREMKQLLPQKKQTESKSNKN